MIDLDNIRDPARLPTDELLAFLADVADDLSATLDRAEQLYDLRRRLYVAGRNRSPRVTLVKLAEVSKTGTAAVTQVLRKERQQAAG